MDLSALIRQIGASPAPEPLAKVDALLRFIIQTLSATDSDVLLSPPLWRHPADLIYDVCANAADHYELQERRERRERMFYKLAAVESDSSPRRSQMDELSVRPSSLMCNCPAQ